MKLSVSIVATTLAATFAAALTGCEQPPAGPVGDALSGVERRARPRLVLPGASSTPSSQADRRPAARRADGAGAHEREQEVSLDADLGVKRLVIAKGVEGREPVEPTATFPTSFEGPIYAFLEVQNRDRIASEVYVSFQREGGIERGPITLRVGASPRWRTWANTRLAKREGTWFAVVRDASGKELARESFQVTTGAPATPGDQAETDQAPTEQAESQKPEAQPADTQQAEPHEADATSAA